MKRVGAKHHESGVLKPNGYLGFTSGLLPFEFK